MKAIAILVAIFRGCSKTGAGGARLAAGRATRSMVKRLGGEAGRGWGMAAAKCYASRSSGIALPVLFQSSSVVMSATYDADLLVSFLAIAETGSLQAARRLGLRQSTISQHVGRLEAATRRRPLRPGHPQSRPHGRWRGLDRARRRDPRRLFAGGALFLDRRAPGPRPLRRFRGHRPLQPAAAGAAGPSPRNIPPSTSR